MLGCITLRMAEPLLRNIALLIDADNVRPEGIDPVLTGLVQELIASQDSGVSALAMQALAAQSRFVQSQRRMELPLGELPGDLFHKALLLMQHLLDDDAG